MRALWGLTRVKAAGYTIVITLVNKFLYHLGLYSDYSGLKGTLPFFPQL